jgi:hypothetical protein
VDAFTTQQQGSEDARKLFELEQEQWRRQCRSSLNLHRHVA